MELVTSIAELRDARHKLAEPLGLVPTMGFLHEGHLSLVRRARQECESVVVSIFVNPSQFGPTEDLDSYPADLERDLALLDAEQADLVWTPDETEIYGPHYQTWVEVTELTQHLEGSAREGHFRGVTTIVANLFNVVQPARAYFGQKDAQQLVVIRKMVEDLNFPLDVVGCPTVREPDGLAMSSRNMHLSANERQAATVLNRALQSASDAYDRGATDAGELRSEMERVLAAEPLARPEYVSVADSLTLEESNGPVDQALLSMAVFVGKTRLIDNITVGR